MTKEEIKKTVNFILGNPVAFNIVKAAVAKGYTVLTAALASVMATFGPVGLIVGIGTAGILAAYIIDNWDELEARFGS